MFFKSIRFKASLAFVVFVTVFASASLLMVTDSAERTSLEELLTKGRLLGDITVRVTRNTSPQLLWKELGTKFTEHGDETLFMAAVDRQGIIRAHSLSFMTGQPFTALEGKVLEMHKDGSSVRKVVRAGVTNYEFKRPLVISGMRAGDIYIALDSYPITNAGRRTRSGILILSALSLLTGIPAILFISSRFTTPLKKLSESINMLPTAGTMEDIKAPAMDETGELIERFNRMSKTILEQKRELKQNSLDLEESYVATLRLLAAVIDARDKYTRGHSARVARLSIALGQRLGLDEAETKDLEISSMFHDVGKIRIPDSILNKEDPLSEDEYKEMMKHARFGANILGVAASLQKHIPAALYHHERYDGSGYPEGLKSDEIPMAATIISLADAFDAMTTSRPYRPAMTRQEAIDELMRGKGTQFNPHITEKFIELLKNQGHDIDQHAQGYFSDI